MINEAVVELVDTSIELTGSSLTPGESTYSELCPKCNGGVNNDRSFSITKTNNYLVLYHCHRAKCGYSGRVVLHNEVPVAGSTAAGRVKQASKAPTGYRHKLNAEAIRVIYQLYGITRETLASARVEMCDNRVAIPIWCEGKSAGWEMRKLPPYNGEQKSLHYRKDNSGLWLGEFGVPWPFTTSKYVWLVEDTWSAMKVSQELDCQAISLMGTHISLDTATYLRHKSNNYYLALDKDASQKALVYKRKYSMVLPNLSVVFLSKDMKYLSRDEMLELIS